MTPLVKIQDVRYLPANYQTARLLNINENEEIVNLSLIGYADDEPIVLYNSFMSAKIGRTTVEEARRREGMGEAFSTFELYRDCCGVMPKVTNQTFEAALADESVASLLKIKKSSPVFKVTSIIYDRDEQPIEFKQSFYRGDKFNFNISRLHPDSD
jgi:GntR family transcriptional regulator